ncbi:MAG: polysaccharide biosynthesis tyrosine autokinase [Rhodospirillales bacterium]|nr:MAG: polysaccharide biosynthesis tyrosine autokinase [Rhodospirillales bacterium]
MEKIQKALERARQQRAEGEVMVARPSGPTTAGAASTQPATAPRSPGGRVNGKAPAGTAAAGVAAPTAITYRETQVVTPSERDLGEQRVIAGLSHHDMADTFRVLRAQVIKKLEEAGHTSLAITSANRGEGKSLTSVNLAVSLAMHVNRTVLLVDTDLRRPSVHRYFGLAPDNGLVEYLSGDTPLSSCLINPGIDRLVILPVRTPLPGSSELLGSPRMVGLAEELRSRYPDRIVIYDLPPVLVSDDALAFLRHVESCLLVIEDNSTEKADIQRTLELLKDCRIIGSVLNKCRQKKQAYY